MWLFLSECERVEGSDDIVFLRVPVNHNCVNSKVAHEITNNILGNPVHAELANNFHEPNMGTDMHCLLTYNTKVSLCPSLLSCLLVKYEILTLVLPVSSIGNFHHGTKHQVSVLRHCIKKKNSFHNL